MKTRLLFHQSENNKVNYEVIWNKIIQFQVTCIALQTEKLKDELKKYMDFIISPEGQKVVESMEYIPLPTKK